MIQKNEQNGTTVVIECTNKQDFKKLEAEWEKLGIKMNREFKVQERGHYVIEYTKKESQYATIKNTEVREIMEDYEHYEYITGEEFKTVQDYYELISFKYQSWNFSLEDAIEEGRNPLNIQLILASMKPEVEQLEHIHKWRLYSGSITSCYYMNGVLRHIWDMECSGYSNNPFFDFQKLVKMVNAYWKIKTPVKAPNKVAYGWQFSMEKADYKYGYMSKSWKLYMWGCIKNYLIKNGIEFTKEESLKVRKIVGLADIYDTSE